MTFRTSIIRLILILEMLTFEKKNSILELMNMVYYGDMMHNASQSTSFPRHAGFPLHEAVVQS